MQFIAVLYLLPLLLSSIISFFMIVMVMRRPSPYRLPLIILMIFIMDWSLGYSMELLGNGVEEKLFWVKVEYFGIVGIPPVWLILVLQYIGKEKMVNKKNVLLLSIDPIIATVLVWTNDMHHLIWKKIEIMGGEPFSMLQMNYGIWSQIRIIYVYLIVISSIILLIHASLKSFRFYKKQSYLLVSAALAPLIGNVLYTSKITPIDLTPFGFSITGIIITWGLLRFRIFDILPMAKDVIIENMRDGIIVVDSNYRIIKINPAARKFLGGMDIVGKSVDELDGICRELSKYCKAGEEMREEVEVVNGEKRIYEVFSLPLFDDYGNRVGCMVSIHDITEIKEAEKALRSAHEEMKRALEKEKEFKLKTAHYFFNPLSIAEGYLNIVKEKCDHKEIHKALEAIKRIERVVKNIIQEGEIKE